MTTFEEGGFRFKVAEGAAEIIGLPEGFSNLAALPPTLGGLPVKAISTAAFDWPDPPPPRFQDGDGKHVAPDGVVLDANQTLIISIPFDLEELVISASVREIDPYICDLYFLKSIRVDEGNRHFSSINGMLLNADRTVLLAVPTDMTGVCHIPASVEVIDELACGYIPSVTALNVDPNNRNYCSVEGVVYTRDLSELVVIPDGFVGKLTVPQGVRRLHFGHFRSAISLTEVEFPSSLSELIKPSAPLWTNSLASIEVHPDNQYYRSEEGILFSKDRTRLIRCPPGKTGTYAIPPTVVALDDYAFSGCSKLDRIDVPHQFQLSKDTVFEDCEASVCVQHVSDRSRSGYAHGWLGCMEAVDGQCYFRAAQFRNEVMLAGVDDSVTGEFSIPGTLDGRRVERIMRHAFGFVPNLTSVSIPAEVARIDDHVFYACDCLSDILVDTDNPVLSSYDGCLYDKYRTLLMRCPCGKEGVLKIPASTTEIGKKALSECVKLSAFDVSTDNSTFASYDDALYDKNLTTLMRVPPCKNGVLSLPATVEHVWEDAFEWCDWITYAKTPARKQNKRPLFLPVPICWVP